VSILGASLASSVAQSPVQAQEAAGQRDRVDAESAREARNIRDLFQAHMSALEEDETDADSPTNPHIDQNLPDRQPDPQPREGKAKRRNTQVGTADSVTLSSTTAQIAAGASAPPEPVSPDSPLYRHLDIQA
jgi:hypothetical protein